MRHMFVLAHLSDPHLSPLPRPRLSELASKRAVGFANWIRKRRLDYRADILDAIERDIAAAQPDHIAVTGDLVNIALAAEFAPARAFLDRLGPSDRVSFVPGNHDAYVRATTGHAHLHWGDFMRGEGAGSGLAGKSSFPFVRRRGPVALIGLSTALPTAPMMATGWLGPDQLARFAAELPRLKREGLFRVVLIHHSPTAPRSEYFKRLVDAAPFLRVLKHHGAELLLHGHRHVRSLVWLDGPDGKIPTIGVPSASAAATKERLRAGYNLYRIDGAPGGWSCEMASRGVVPGQPGIADLGRQQLFGISEKPATAA
jgi:3',5'-cyclic AMP phosphodiesterase CpdA